MLYNRAALGGLCDKLGLLYSRIANFSRKKRFFVSVSVLRDYPVRTTFFSRVHWLQYCEQIPDRTTVSTFVRAALKCGPEFSTPGFSADVHRHA